MKEHSPCSWQQSKSPLTYYEGSPTEGSAGEPDTVAAILSARVRRLTMSAALSSNAAEGLQNGQPLWGAFAQKD